MLVGRLLHVPVFGAFEN